MARLERVGRPGVGRRAQVNRGGWHSGSRPKGISRVSAAPGARGAARMRGSVSVCWRRLWTGLRARARPLARGTDQPNAARLTREGELSTHRSRRRCAARLFDRRPGRTRRRGDSQDAPTERPSRTVALLSDSNGSLPLHRGRMAPYPCNPARATTTAPHRAREATSDVVGPQFSQIHKFTNSNSRRVVLCVTHETQTVLRQLAGTFQHAHTARRLASLRACGHI